MSYGHAERNLALIRQLEAETRQLVESLVQPVQEQDAERRPVVAAHGETAAARRAALAMSADPAIPVRPSSAPVTGSITAASPPDAGVAPDPARIRDVAAPSSARS
jgi:hypothetical protein